MKVGTDGVLLGAWAGCEHPARILDVGTGTGLIALMLAQRFPDASVDAIEIDPSAANQAGENFSHSPWPGRLSVRQLSLQAFAESHPDRYSLIVSNPPWFSHSLKASTLGRNLARHDDNLSAKELLDCSRQLILPEGWLCLILPATDADRFIRMAEEFSFFPRRILYVRPVPGRPLSRVLLNLARTPGKAETHEIVIESAGRHVYSDDYKKLTRDFYLAF